jgi:hypothetical protein
MSIQSEIDCLLYVHSQYTYDHCEYLADRNLFFATIKLLQNKHTTNLYTMTVKDDPKEPEIAVGGAGFGSALDASPEPAVAFGQPISTDTKLDAATAAILQSCDSFLIQYVSRITRPSLALYPPLLVSLYFALTSFRSPGYILKLVL